MHSIDIHVRITYFSAAHWRCLALRHQQYYSETEISIPISTTPTTLARPLFDEGRLKHSKRLCDRRVKVHLNLLIHEQ